MDETTGKVFVIVFFAIWIIAGVILATFEANGEEFKAYKDKQAKNERESVTDTSHEAEPEEIYVDIVRRPNPKPEQYFTIDVDLGREYQKEVDIQCEKYGLDFYLVMALIQRESMYDAECISVSGDYGLMQINECNHEWLREELGIDDFLDGKQNIQAGCYMLSELYKKYGVDDKVLMAYNMGEGNAKKCWEQGVFSSKYSRDIRKIAKELKLANED